MKHSLLFTLCAATLLSPPLFAEEGDPARGKPQEFEQRARTAKEVGQADEVQKLREQLQRLRAELDKREGQPGGGEKLAKMKSKIGELHQAGKHEEAQQLEQQLRQGMEKQGYRENGDGDAERRAHAREA